MQCALLIVTVIILLMLATNNMFGVDANTLEWIGVVSSGAALYYAHQAKMKMMPGASAPAVTM